jgi:hypothetical protein
MHVFIPRFRTAVVLFGLSVSAFSQATNLSEALPPQTVVTNGRTVLISAPTLPGRIQWQIPAGGNSWSNLSDDSRYQGTSTKTLGISQTEVALSGSSYRFVHTAVDGVETASNATKLVVSPLLFPAPAGILLDFSGGVYVSDASDHTIRYIANAESYGVGNLTDRDGRRLFCPVSVVAGRSGEAGAKDGLAGAALFNQPGGISMGLNPTNGVIQPDLIGRPIFVGDTANGTIRRLVISGGTVSTFAGSSTLRGNSDGPGSAATFSGPIGVTRALDGTIFVVDSTNHTIRKITVDGTVSTFAGSPGNAGTADGKGPDARFNNPTGITIDAAGTIFVADTTNNLIRRITPLGEVTTLAGLAGIAGSSDGLGSKALFNGPTGLVADGGGVYVADTGNSTIRFIYPDGTVRTHAGTPGVSGLQDSVWVSGGPLQALFNQPRALASGHGLLFIADTGNAAIRVISWFDGWTLTLPLTEDALAYQFPQPTSTATPPAPTTPTTPTTPVAPSSASASSGGGAIGGWFVLALVLTGMLGKLLKRAA